jgi:hypothetical protein
MRTKMKTLPVVIILAGAVLLVGVASRFRVAAQDTFAGATIVTHQYFDCEPGAPNCEPSTKIVRTLAADRSQSIFTYWLKPEESKSDPLLGEAFFANGDSVHVMGAVGEFYTIRVRHPKTPELNASISDDCVSLASPSHKKISGIEEIAAQGNRYKRVLFSMNDGMHSDTINYLPGFGCISFPEKSGNGEHSIRSVLVQASAGVDPAKLSRTPAGLKETRPSEAYRDSMTRSLQLQGFTRQQIESRWLESLAKSPLDQYDTLWEAGLAFKK